MRKLLIFILLLSITVSSGCARRVRGPKLESMGLVGVIGFDLAEDGRTEMTVAMPQFPYAFEEEIQFFSATVDLTHEALVEFTKKSDKLLKYSHLMVVLFSEKYAREKGLIQPILDMYRNCDIGDDVYIAVTKASAKEIMMMDLPHHPTLVRYLSFLLEPREETAFNPFATIHDFVRRSTSNVYDPVVPYIEKQKDKSIKISKIAIFENDKMIDTITPEEANILESLTNRKKLSAIKLETEEKDDLGNPLYVMIEFIQSNVEMSSNKNLDSPKVKVKLNFVGTLMGYTGDRNLDKPEGLLALEDLLNKNMEKQVFDLLNKLKKLKVDPIGVGQEFRMYHRGKWNKDLWREAIPNIEYNIEVDSKFLNTGTID
ncbi:Ger(x)C family spore germination protein [Alkaliphilus hydrothermalis]|uniref:Spore germination protein n=1 Tax=Alkaliphilus hydrothermalis TaxID=1482730 RepID=A0ABS2NPE7_9FIRM|nr:Ger(x)C family spore germination protein [Alkaliphilus hydrothermalis]MBM7614821.1 spore germination protein [Alkaliphilus hydrothermalis]